MLRRNGAEPSFLDIYSTWNVDWSYSQHADTHPAGTGFTTQELTIKDHTSFSDGTVVF